MLIHLHKLKKKTIKPRWKPSLNIHNCSGNYQGKYVILRETMRHYGEIWGIVAKYGAILGYYRELCEYI